MSPKTKARKLREKILTENYKSQRDALYFQALEENAVNNFAKNGNHIEVFNTENPHIDVMLETLSNQSGKSRFREGFKQNKSKRKKKN